MAPSIYLSGTWNGAMLHCMCTKKKLQCSLKSFNEVNKIIINRKFLQISQNNDINSNKNQLYETFTTKSISNKNLNAKIPRKTSKISVSIIVIRTSTKSQHNQHIHMIANVAFAYSKTHNGKSQNSRAHKKKYKYRLSCSGKQLIFS